MRGFLGLSLAFCLGSTAISGEFTEIGATGGVYSFTGCVKPQAPDLSLDPTLKGRKAQRAINRSFKRYNDYVETVNSYLECISLEAGRDLQTYNKAVSATFEASQNDVIETVEVMRIDLGLDEAQEAGVEEDLEQSLVGGASTFVSRTADETVNQQLSDDQMSRSADENEREIISNNTLEDGQSSVSDVVGDVGVAARDSDNLTEANDRNSDLTMDPIGH